LTEGEWRSERLKHIADVAFSSVDKKSVKGEIAVRLCNYTDVYYNDEITADLHLMEATASLDQVRSFGLRAGDVLITKDSETADDIGVPAFVPNTLHGVVAGYHLAVLRPKQDRVDPKYLFWSISGTLAREQMSVSASGVTRYGLRFGDVGNLHFPVPDHDKQREVANFLDRATPRIDKAIERRLRMKGLLDEWFWNGFVERVAMGSPTVVPIRRVLSRITDGPFGSAFSSADYSVDGGAAVVRLGNIGFGEYRSEDQAFISPELYASFTRHRVVEGDLLIAGLGDDINHAGRACVAPDLGLAIVKGKCFCAGVDSQRASARYLAWLLSSPIGKEAMKAAVRGSTRSMINLEIVKDVDLPLPSLSDQEEIADWMEARR
jgi:type I restriction enzyme S subunit